MPIRTVKIDFNDGMSPIGNQEGYYKNAKPYCAPSIGECGTSQLTCTTDKDCTDAGLTGTNATCSTEQTNFGNQERACTQNYFEYNYVYRCYGTESGAHKVQVNSLPTAIKQRVLRYPNITEIDHICAYKPKVQVTDNWGWCNAVDAGVVGGRYDENCDNSNSWTSYAQTVYVVPRVSN